MKVPLTLALQIWYYNRIVVDTVFLTRVKEGDFCEGKVADLEETKRCTGLESADGPEGYAVKTHICPF